VSRRINLRAAELTDAEREYISTRSWMLRARVEVETQRSNGVEVPETDPEVEAEVTVEEWVAQASKAEVVAELKEREIEHDPKSRKADLDVLLINAVHEGETENQSSE
jgi:hypothetical protein